MHSQGEAQSIQNSSFPIATPRIQKAMKLLIQYVNNNNNNSNYRNIITRGCTSSSFASSWNDNSNLVVTLHYCYNNLNDKVVTTCHFNTFLTEHENFRNKLLAIRRFLPKFHFPLSNITRESNEDIIYLS